jgi:signal transduction histidine kinase/ActR/RegA family two-component response regulator
VGAVVSVPVEDVFRNFRRDAISRGALTAVLLGIIGLLGALLVRRIRELEAAVRMRQALEQEVFRASKLESLGVLAGGIAHDFNNLLAAILSGVEVARHGLPADSEGAAALEDSAAATRRATALTRQLLAFSKGGAPVRETTDVGDLLRESARFVLHGSRSSLRLEIAEDLRAADVDPGQISQVVQNLVLNADQAMAAGGEIVVTARNLDVEHREEEQGGALAPGRYVELAVADAGVGIAPENLERIFDPFFTTKLQGHGLGLATVHAIVRNHGGAIRVRSEQGLGTRISVALPAAAEGAVPASSGAPAADAAADAIPAGTRVLVLDDEEGVRRGVARMLRQLGCEPQTCAEGRDAVERYRSALATERPFDVVLTDVTLPGGMSGPETALEIRRLDAGARILVSSGYADVPLAAEPALHGVDGYVAKPYGIEQLREAIARVLRSRAA